LISDLAGRILTRFIYVSVLFVDRDCLLDIAVVRPASVYSGRIVLTNDLIGGTIGAAQYDQWRSHFGQPPGVGSGTSTNAAVPEPKTLVLLMCAAVGWCLCRGRAT
jgi:hypothetical protein